MSKPPKERLPRSDIPPDYACPYPACIFQTPESSKRPELAFRNHMAMVHGVYYEKAPLSDVKTKLAKYTKTVQDYEAMKEISQLASWHCAALARHEVTGLPLSALAKDGKHSAETLRAVARSPAGQKYIAGIRSNLHDPVQTVKSLLAAGMVNKLLDWEQAWQWAMAAKAYDSVHRMAKDIGLQPALDSGQQAGPTKISLHLNMSDLGTPAVKTSFTLVEEPEYEIEDPDGDN